MKANQGSTYRIRIKETLNKAALDWFNDVDISLAENGETVLVARFPDQPALRGFLDQLWNLNLTLLSVEQLENKKDHTSGLDRHATG
jgi:hypothetical protein